MRRYLCHSVVRIESNAPALSCCQQKNKNFYPSANKGLTKPKHTKNPQFSNQTRIFVQYIDAHIAFNRQWILKTLFFGRFATRYRTVQNGTILQTIPQCRVESRKTKNVIPAKAGIHKSKRQYVREKEWIPPFRVNDRMFYSN